MEKLRIREVLVVEGRYDAAKLSALVDGLIITTGGFSIFSDPEKRALLKRLGEKHGLIILTDSDAAGFRIRRYINQFASGVSIKNVYIPSVKGKEARKAVPSKEGLLGVEGMPAQLLYQALETAGATKVPDRAGRPITFTDLYELGISGTPDSAEKRRKLLLRLGLPLRLSKKALVEVLNSLYSYEEFCALARPKPVLFWDFHGTLTLPDILWFEAAQTALQDCFPGLSVTRETIEKHFTRACLPWYHFEEHDTRALIGAETWWTFCEEQFTAMFVRCGLTREQAKCAAPYIRAHILNPKHYTLYPDAVKTLQVLKQRGYRNFILSNNFPELAAVTAGLGLSACIEGVISSANIGYDKPRKELFIHALKTAEAEEGVMIGDSIEDDIAGASRAGFFTVAVHHEAPVAQADLTINNLEELLAYLP